MYDAGLLQPAQRISHMIGFSHTVGRQPLPGSLYQHLVAVYATRLVVFCLLLTYLLLTVRGAGLTNSSLSFTF
jgi:hypothetical protein